MIHQQKWMHDSEALHIELDQLKEEGKDVRGLQEKVDEILSMKDGPEKEERAAAFLDYTYALPLRADAGLVEPDELSLIKKEAAGIKDMPFSGDLYDKVYGAWLARCAGCLLGKPYEGWRRRHIVGLLKDTNNYPPKFYTSAELSQALIEKYDMDVKRAWINNVSFMPEDDDTNYTALSLKLVEEAGRDFTSEDVAERWLWDLPILHVCTAERVAYRNLVALRLPPLSAQKANPYREWIGAQIRGDYFGYINPGAMELAADMAWRDASISHVKNGIYGEMFMSAAIAAAFCVDTPRQAIEAGMQVIPQKSRLYMALEDALSWPSQGLSWEQALDRVHENYDEDNPHHWCHTISNAVICLVALLYGEGDMEKTIGIALLAAFDTDCNAASVGSVIGALLGAKALPKAWIDPLNDTLLTGVDGYNRVKISDMAKKTLEHIK